MADCLDGIGKRRVRFPVDDGLEVLGQEVIIVPEGIHSPGFQGRNDILRGYRYQFHFIKRYTVPAKHIAEPVQHGYLPEVHHRVGPDRDGQPSAPQVRHALNWTVRTHKDAPAFLLERSPEQHAALALGAGPERRDIAAFPEDQRGCLGKVGSACLCPQRLQQHELCPGLLKGFREPGFLHGIFGRCRYRTAADNRLYSHITSPPMTA